MAIERPEIDPEKLAQFSGGARVQTRRKLPFERHDPDAKPDKAFRFDTNAYDRELFRYAAMMRQKGETVWQLIRTLAREQALKEVAKSDR